MSCLFPLQRELHAVCHSGACADRFTFQALWIRLTRSERTTKTYEISELMNIYFFNDMGGRNRNAFSEEKLYPCSRFKLGRVPTTRVSVWCRSRSLQSGFRPSTIVDTSILALNNPCMPRPAVPRRVKTYSAATGYVYQYYFYEVKKSRHGNTPGTHYVYMVSVDRHEVFPLNIFVVNEALEKWSARAGQQLTGTEEYAVAKMRLFQAFDEVQGLGAKTADLLVDDANLDALLSELDV